MLSKRFALRIGMCAVIDGELPIGGLSSSAVVIITFLSALCKLNNINLIPAEMIQIDGEAENKYVGVACDNPDVVKKLKDGAAGCICQKYNLDDVAEQIMKLYQS